MKKLLLAGITMLFCVSTAFSQDAIPIWSNNSFDLFKDKIVQGKYTGRALSATELHSDYQSPANLFKSPDIVFKFSINGKDNEMKSGTDHHFNAASKDGNRKTPLIKFGDAAATGNASSSGYLAPSTKLTIRLDMRDVLASFNTKGYFVTFKNDTIYKQDFKGVYVAGNTAPLIWDFDNLYNHAELKLSDEDGDGIFETTIVLNNPDQDKQTASGWQLSKKTTAFPQYSSSFPLSDALYNLSLEEMIKAVEPDSTFRTGKEWAGVWTRDISYSIILSMAYLQPRVAMNSLLKKVNKKKKIIQDTGTGGAWPVSTDRMIWAVAAWELYKVTGDKEWLKQAYEIISNSLEDDYLNVYDKSTGLVHGESSFLDWREQTYPKWMQPADIYESENAGTNAVHYEANIVAAKMAGLLNKNTEARNYDSVATVLKQSINKYLWMQDKGYYGQYLYGRINKILSPRSEALGEALCVLFDIADAKMAAQVISSTPVNVYGIPCIYPQIPGIPPYHNNAVWPFVQTYWLMAAAKINNEIAVMESIAAIYRSAALFLTNKENFVAETGDYKGTQINSSNMLWSLSGNLSIVQRLFFGIHFNEDNLVFTPFVPRAFAGARKLTGFTYRNAILDIELQGWGHTIKSFQLDNQQQQTFSIPSSLSGRHRVKIVLQNDEPAKDNIKSVENYTSVAAPQTSYANHTLLWPPVNGAVKYAVIKDGKLLQVIKDTNFAVTDNSYAEYAVTAIDNKNIPSFSSEPMETGDYNNISKYEFETFAPKAAYDYKGYSGEGFTETSTSKNTKIEMLVSISAAGEYLLQCRYANGNGPINTENKCALRTILCDGKTAGVFVLPQRGTEEWSNWGWSNAVKIDLPAGQHTLSVEYLPANENMNGITNAAMLDYIRVIRTGK